MADIYSIDSHKLIYHPTLVSKWYEAKDNYSKLKKIYPIYVEISPNGGCNHRCTFCAMDYMGYKNHQINTNVLKNTLSNMAKNGVKSVNFAGEGEPLLHKELGLVLEHCSKVGIDSSLTTNFALANKDTAKILIKHCSWIKISLNAGTKESYSKIHKTKEKDFDKVIENIKNAVIYKKENNLKCTIGVQMLLLPENKNEAVTLGQICKEIGVDYLVIKPYSHKEASYTVKYKDINYALLMDIEEELNTLNNKNFNVIFRANTMKKHIQKKHSYNKCLSTPFFYAYISTDGKVYGCSSYLGKDIFCYGNINDNSFEDIWQSDKRKTSYEYVRDLLDIKNCRTNCRMDEVNKYLWDLKNPAEHINFI